ncbi:MAG: carboxynorspermidine decarboxylase [Bacteroidetes bacterium GWE2_29_8]|nr:MAG: carboxynorspermidine decarboxylase [Bacteroidetes bacterium GWE2_29_8]OFY19643.1 MAG: carboxynorspermidine decarboxylase [Bacteroidetes bacterium GWF2_29_10]
MNINFSEVPSPCYVLDESLLIKNLELLDYVQKKADCKIICALKGFSFFNVFPLVGKYLSGASASSLNEVKLSFEEMGKEIHTYCPAYIDNDFEKILEYSDHITFNSLNQFEKHKDSIKKSKKAVSIGLRINPEYSEIETDLYNPAVKGSRLGIIANMIKELPKEVKGLHFHVLCENDSFVLERTLKHVEEKFGDLLHKVKWLNMGGGHHITRKDYDVEHLISLIRKIKEKYDVEVILEPGEAVGWQTGYLVTTIIDIVENNGIKVALIDSSFANHMPDCLEMPYKPSVIGSVEKTKGKHMYSIGGITCLAGDYIEKYYFEKELNIGDKIIFDDMIHYTMVKTTTFNGINLPAIGVWTIDNKFKLLKKFGFEDYKNRLS